MHFCLFSYWPYKYENIYIFFNHLDIHFRDIINKNVISDVSKSYFISGKYFFFENIFWYAASKISIFVNL